MFIIASIRGSGAAQPLNTQQRSTSIGIEGESFAYYQPAGSQGTHERQVQVQERSPAAQPPEARRLHPRLHHHAQEAPTPEPVPEPTTPSDDNTETDPAGSSKGDNKTTIALKSNTSDGTDAQGSEGEKLDEATPAEGTLETATKSDSVAVTSAGVDAGAEQTASQMPIWPFVGIGLGVLALILILLLGRRKKEDEE